MKRLYPRSDAADYLGMSETSFDAQVSPCVPYVLIGRTGKRYDRLDLDAWVDAQQKIAPSHDKTKAHTQCGTEADRPGSRSGQAESGGSTKPSSTEGEKFDFENRLNAARSKQRLTASPSGSPRPKPRSSGPRRGA